MDETTSTLKTLENCAKIMGIFWLLVKITNSLNSETQIVFVGVISLILLVMRWMAIAILFSFGTCYINLSQNDKSRIKQEVKKTTENNINKETDNILNKYFTLKSTKALILKVFFLDVLIGILLY